MLQRLHIRNLAIVSDLVVDFSAGLNILSGETGAGKSIILGAIALLLGERAQVEMVRSGEELAVIEGTLVVPPNLAAHWAQFGLETDSPNLEIRREIKRSSASRSFINGQMIAVGDLKRLGAELVDLVGQHHQQLLLDPERHIGFLDDYAGNQSLLAEYHEAFTEYVTTKAALAELRRKAAAEAERAELNRFQLAEIEAAKPAVEEEARLRAEKQVLENAEALKAAYYDVAEQLHHGDRSATETISTALAALEPLQKHDATLEESLAALKGSLYGLQEVGRFLRNRSETIEADPQRLQEIERRLDTYYSLKMKYGGSVEAVLAHADRLRLERAGQQDVSSRIADLAEKLERLFQRTGQLAGRLSERRRDAATRLARAVEKALVGLEMGKVKFEVDMAYAEATGSEFTREGRLVGLRPDGIDQVEFRFSPNPGEELKPLAKIASGGELSRVLLALKAVAAQKSRGAAMIFDEIDSGIGGRTAAAVGNALLALSKGQQVIVITHLQQIAVCGQHHFLVYKEKSGGRMVTRIKRLTESERRNEIGRMLAGEEVTELSLKQAKELLQRDKE